MVVVFNQVGMGSVGRSKMLLSSFWFAWIRSGAPRGRRVHSGYLGFTWVRLGVFGFIRIPVGSLGCVRVMESSDSSLFAWDNLGAPRGRRIIRVRMGSLWRA